MNHASVQRYTLGSGDIIGVRGGESIGRLILRVSADTRLAMSEPELDTQFILFKADTTLVLDPPNLLSSTDLFLRLDSGSSGVVELLRC